MLEMKHVTTGAHLLTPWLFEPVKRPDDRADCLDYMRLREKLLESLWSSPPAHENCLRPGILFSNFMKNTSIALFCIVLFD